MLFEAPTIALCAAMIRERIGDTDAATTSAPGSTVPQTKRRFVHLVPMHDGEGGERTPFFLVAGMFGNVLNLRHLARLLGTDRPFYGLQARGLYGDQAPHETFEEAATDYIAEMRQVQPHGPYLLGGFSGGGITAFEIARQLESAGETVRLLVLLDTPLPMRPPLNRTDKALIKLAELRKGGAGFILDWARQRTRWELDKLRNRNAPPLESQSHQLNNEAIQAAFLRALPTYRLQTWNGPAVLFRPPLSPQWKVAGGRWVSSEREYLYEDNNWTPYLPKLRVLEVPGNHDSMVLEPNVRVMASLLKDCIEETQEPGAAE